MKMTQQRLINCVAYLEGRWQAGACDNDGELLWVALSKPTAKVTDSDVPKNARKARKRHNRAPALGGGQIPGVDDHGDRPRKTRKGKKAE